MRPLTQIALMAAALGGFSGPMRYEQAPPTLTPAELERKQKADAERMEAAQAKRRRKLERWTNTPEAKARHAETLAQLERGFVWSFRAKAFVPGVPQSVPPAVCNEENET